MPWHIHIMCDGDSHSLNNKKITVKRNFKVTYVNHHENKTYYYYYIGQTLTYSPE